VERLAAADQVFTRQSIQAACRRPRARPRCTWSANPRS